MRNGEKKEEKQRKAMKEMEEGKKKLLVETNHQTSE
jgi:hypothetical protein